MGNAGCGEPVYRGDFEERLKQSSGTPKPPQRASCSSTSSNHRDWGRANLRAGARDCVPIAPGPRWLRATIPADLGSETTTRNPSAFEKPALLGAPGSKKIDVKRTADAGGTAIFLFCAILPRASKPYFEELSQKRLKYTTRRSRAAVQAWSRRAYIHDRKACRTRRST